MRQSCERILCDLTSLTFDLFKILNTALPYNELTVSSNIILFI